NTGALYDPIADTWAPTSLSNAPSPRYYHGAAWTGSRMVIWGGHDSASFLNTGGRYDPSTDTWQPMTTVGAPTARQLPSALWTGSKVILWGGAPQASIGDTI